MNPCKFQTPLKAQVIKFGGAIDSRSMAAAVKTIEGVETSLSKRGGGAPSVLWTFDSVFSGQSSQPARELRRRWKIRLQFMMSAMGGDTMNKRLCK